MTKYVTSIYLENSDGKIYKTRSNSCSVNISKYGNLVKLKPNSTMKGAGACKHVCMGGFIF